MAAVRLFLLALCRLAAAWRSSGSYIRDGFKILPGVIDAKKLAEWAERIDRYIDAEHLAAKPGRKKRKDADKVTSSARGYSVLAIHQVGALRPIYDEVKQVPKLHAALASLLGSGYRALNKNDLTVDRGGNWHIDMPTGAFSYYAEGLPSYWEALPDGDGARVVNVLIYLEDHKDDERALTIMPGTHDKPHGQWGAGVVLQESPNETETLVLKPSLGDVVVLDARLWHRGMDRKHEADTSLKRVPRRRCLSFDFGANNAFTERVERAYAMRNAWVLNKTNLTIDCDGLGVQIQIKQPKHNRAIGKSQDCWLEHIRREVADMQKEEAQKWRWSTPVINGTMFPPAPHGRPWRRANNAKRLALLKAQQKIGLFSTAQVTHAARHLVFDIGFNVGGDTFYYLSAGYRVVAVEANVNLLEAARLKQPFKKAIETGQLVLLNAAIGSASGKNLTFWVRDADDGETSTVYQHRCDKLSNTTNTKCRPYTVPVWSCGDLVATFGMPLYVKVDIERSDHLCIDSIARHACLYKSGPVFMSAEDMPLNSLIGLLNCGYNSFKCLDQEPYWKNGSFYVNDIGSSSGPFGDAPLDKQTSSSAWRPLEPFINVHREHAKLAQRHPALYSVIGTKADQCSRSDLHVKRDLGEGAHQGRSKKSASGDAYSRLGFHAFG